MIEKINGQRYRDMIDYGMRNLNAHCKLVNRLNVFPVPDGDTGTNMVTTLKNGLFSIGAAAEDLPTVSKRFASSVVFGARGNSGVILSQFFKGISEIFFDVEYADAALLIKALEHGVECAYTAVAVPVQGTILTVVKDATEAVKKEYNEGTTIDDVISSFIKHAKVSLDRTPELLPALKEAGVVDSGGAGVVYTFEGMMKYLNGEALESVEQEETATATDYSAFNRDSSFDYGYCTELLVQLLNSKREFNYKTFKIELGALGDSLVTSAEGDKVRIHIHTKTPEAVLMFCHRYGEFLSVKIENMTVQHTETVKNILRAETKSDSVFSVVAVANDANVQKLFLSMGADVVICSEESPSVKEYVEAFDMVDTGEILVFPNRSDSLLTALQAKKSYKKANVTVIGSRSVAECYGALPIIDFSETDVSAVADAIAETINSMYVVTVAKRSSDLVYGVKGIQKTEYYAFSGKEILTVSRSLKETVVQTAKKICTEQDKEILTLFYSKLVPKKEVEEMVKAIEGLAASPEVYTIHSENLPCVLALSFE